jgi:hypothetical protein
VTSSIRTRSCSLTIKGHLFEWLIAHDISCANSEFDGMMLAPAKRHPNCIGAAPVSDPQVYNSIVENGAAPGICVICYTHNSNQ